MNHWFLQLIHIVSNLTNLSKIPITSLKAQSKYVSKNKSNLLKTWLGLSPIKSKMKFKKAKSPFPTNL